MIYDEKVIIIVLNIIKIYAKKYWTVKSVKAYCTVYVNNMNKWSTTMVNYIGQLHWSTSPKIMLIQ
jgi:ABC-type proline/glycine betaine transport system permease subunit